MKTRSLYAQITAYVTPMIAGNVLQLITGTATAAMLGRLLGADALAASGVIYPISLLVYAFFTGLTTGATILVARAQGAGDLEKTKRLTVEALSLSVLAGALCTLIGLALAVPILHALGTPQNIFGQTVQYLQIVMGSMLVFLPYMMYGALLRGVGDSKTPFYMLIASTTATVLLMPLLIRGLGFVPALGTAGAPAAALIAIGSVTIVVALVLHRYNIFFQVPTLQFRALIPSAATVRDAVTIGVPIGLQYIAVSISELLLLSIVAGQGADAVAVYAAMNQIVAYVMTPMGMMGVAASALAAKEFGAGRAADVPPIFRATTVLTLVLTGELTAVVYLFPNAILGMFLSGPHAMDLAHRAIFVMMWSLPVLGIGSIATSVARADGFAVGPMLANIFGVWLVLLPCAKLFVSHSGAIGVWQAYPAAYVAIAVMECGYLWYCWRQIGTRATIPA